MKKVVYIEGMSCNHCSSRVEKVLNNIDGVTAKVILEEKKAYLDISSALSDEEIVEVISDIGFEVLKIE